MSTIVTRAGKGSILTNTEMDSNFTNLNNDKIQVSTITGTAGKTPLVDADVLPIVDSVGDVLNKVTWANVKATAKTYFDTIYTTSSAVATYVSDLIGSTIMGYIAPSTSGNILTSNGSAWTSAAPASGALVNDFRLTLTTGVPVTTSDVTGATTIYCTPYTGNQISLYSGSAWVTRSSAQFSLALGTLTSGKPYDVFCYDNAGTPTLEFLAWTNDTTRATALAYQDGVLCKSGALTRRYLGTFYTTAATTTEDSASKRYLFNYYNRVHRHLERKETTTSWTYTTPTWRQANGAAANQVNFFTGVVEDAASASVVCTGFNSTAGIVQAVAIGVNSTSSPSGIFNESAHQYEGTMAGHWTGTPSLGLNYLAWIEWSRGTGAATFYGASNSATGQSACGITAGVRA